MRVEEKDWIDIEQAAALLKLSKVTLRRWTNDGRLPCSRVGTRGDRRFNPAELEAYIVSRMRAGQDIYYPHTNGKKR
jgi:excisionase family DNA binding protein